MRRGPSRFAIPPRSPRASCGSVLRIAEQGFRHRSMLPVELSTMEAVFEAPHRIDRRCGWCHCIRTRQLRKSQRQRHQRSAIESCRRDVMFGGPAHTHSRRNRRLDAITVATHLLHTPGRSAEWLIDLERSQRAVQRAVGEYRGNQGLSGLGGGTHRSGIAVVHHSRPTR